MKLPLIGKIINISGYKLQMYLKQKVEINHGQFPF
jgi:hypothetical protein